MVNPLKGIGSEVDFHLLYGAQKAVDVWNWTTGGRKKDFANMVNYAASGLDIMGSFVAMPIVFPIFGYMSLGIH